MLKIVSVFCLVNLALGLMNQLMAQNQVASSDKIKEHVYYLTSDSLKGRETGTRGERLAAVYLANQFNKIGLIPLADDSYFHEFELVRKHRNSMLVKSQGVLLFWPWHFHYVANYKHTDTVNTRLLFAGFGTAEELEKLPIKNKALAFIAENPDKAFTTILRIKKDYGNTRFFVIFSTRSKLMEEA
ncbi:MAG: hypothetical protein AB7S69_07335 [Salinivirgaceae bacterium]